MQRKISIVEAVKAFEVYRIVKKLRPDILDGHGTKDGLHALLFGSFLRVFSLA